MTEFLKASDRAKYIRSELKAMYPHIKFSVKSQNYSTGSNVSVSWTDGPTETSVNNTIDCLTEDMKNLHDLALNTHFNGVSTYRKISEETWNKIESEILAAMKARDDPYINEEWHIRRKVSYEIEQRSF
jgi:hypothetical protein